MQICLGRVALVTWLVVACAGLGACVADSTTDPVDVLADAADTAETVDTPDSITTDVVTDTACSADGPCDTVESECGSATDGAPCGTVSGFICIAATCVQSYCGDGFVDGARAETCDDGNTTNNDGCDADCTWSCEAAAECPDDGELCNGVGECVEHLCAQSGPLSQGAACVTSAGADGVCKGDGNAAASCVSKGCGNGVLEAGELCDDGNTVDGDGCDADCVWSCGQDSECEDGDACNGFATCDTATHTCVAGAEPDCDDLDPCTEDFCDAIGGCSNVLIDADNDGYAASATGCGGDCSDDDNTIYPGAEELCDSKDNDCDSQMDEGAPSWWCDGDGDGYAASGAVAVSSCDAPEATTSCVAWISRSPATEADCDDGDNAIHPGAAEPAGDEIDSNCDGSEVCFKDSDNDGFVTNASSNTVVSTDVDCKDPGEADSSIPRTDCRDSDKAAFPGAAERCNGYSDDCDAQIDEDGPWPSADASEPNDEPYVLIKQFPTDQVIAQGIASTGTKNFDRLNDKDYFKTAVVPFKQNYWKCRVTGMQPGMRVDVWLGVKGGINPSVWTVATTRTNIVNDGIASTSVGFLASPYIYGAGIWPASGVSGCYASYKLECKLSTSSGGW